MDKGKYNSKERLEKMLDAYQQGQTLQQIGNDFGVSRQRVHQILLEYEGRSQRKIRFSKEMLENLYVKQRMSVSKVAKTLSAQIWDIRLHLKEYEISEVSQWEQKIYRTIPSFNETEFVKLYLEDYYSIKDMAKKYGCSGSMIKRMIDKLGISKKNFGISKTSKKTIIYKTGTIKTLHRSLLVRRKSSLEAKQALFSKDMLFDLYITQKLSIAKISRQLSANFNTIKHLLIFNNIPIRSYQEASDLVNKYKYPLLKYLTKDELARLYVEENLSQTKIAILYECSPTAINKRLERYRIKKKIE